jgi:glycosyltransferase involved in cell wall biosynthesis
MDMRIACFLELADSDVEGGRDIATRQLVEHLRHKGVEVDILSFAHGLSCGFPRILRETPILRAVTAFPFCGRKALRSLEGRYDLFYITSTSTASFYRPSTPTVLYCHGVLASKWNRTELPLHYNLFFNPLSRAVMGWFERRCMRNVDAVIGVYHSTVEQVGEVLGESSIERFMLENGVDTSLFTPAEDGGNGVLFVGRASRNKGYDVLLEAAPHIKEPITMVVSRMRKHVMKEAVDPRIDILMNVPFERMPSIYQDSSVFVLPSLDEEHPLVVLEAMACGLPVVATEVAAAGMIGEGEGGFIIPAGDPAALADRVNLLLDDDDLRKDMGERNRALVERSYSWEEISARFLEICEQVVS